MVEIVSTAANNQSELPRMPRTLSNRSTTFILLGIAVLLMPVGAMVGGAAQWVVIVGSAAMLFLCAYNINVNNRRSGRR
jgi:hypothetical protein